MENFSTDLYKTNCEHNLKELLDHENIKQKQLAEKVQLTEATLSKYINGLSLPSTDFLLRLKSIYPYINIDDFLNKHLTFDLSQKTDDTTEVVHLQTDVYKYYGLFNLYYLDTSTSGSLNSNHMYLNTAPALKRGLLYIYRDPNLSGDRAGCIALINITDKNDITNLRQHILSLAEERLKKAKKEATGKDSTDKDATTKDKGTEEIMNEENSSFINEADLSYYLNDVQTALIFQNELLDNKLLGNTKTVYRTYKGSLHMTQNHLHILLQQATDFEEPVSFVLHRKYFRNEHYIGGLGCMTTVSSGHPSEPCIQMVGVSYNDMNMFDYDIKKRLRFTPPVEAHMEGTSQSPEEKQLLRMAALLYQKPTHITPSSAMYDLSPEDKEILFRSKLNYLLRSNAEKNLLYYSKVSLEDDHEWYRLISGKIQSNAEPNEG